MIKLRFIVHHDLGDTRGVPQIDKSYATVVAAAGHPACHGHGLADVFGVEFAELMGAKHVVFPLLNSTYLIKLKRFLASLPLWCCVLELVYLPDCRAQIIRRREPLVRIRRHLFTGANVLDFMCRGPIIVVIREPDVWDTSSIGVTNLFPEFLSFGRNLSVNTPSTELLGDILSCRPVLI